ncbi:MAG: hypothetical protein U9O87_11025, partial [Verrucomicrobiota bacterium]|nr:hypothetical protein [Verrucomicrobiota bacterium]
SVMMIFIKGENSTEIPPVEVTMEELEVKEIEPEVIEEIEELEEQPVEEAVPTVEKPDVTPTENTASTEDFNNDMPQTDDNMDFDAVLDISPNATPLKLSGLYGGRTNSGRKGMLRRFGGSGAGEAAVLRALRWLKDHQNKTTGRWPMDSTTHGGAMTGLALLTFLAHGETPLSEEFGNTVQMGIQYLVEKVNKGGERIGGNGYENGIIAYALSEAYGLTKIPMIKGPMDKLILSIVEGQQPSGGFDYGYKKGARFDVSLSGWQIQALKAAYVSGSTVPGIHKAIEKSSEFLKDVQCKSGARKGYFPYSKKGQGTISMTDVATLCLQLIGEGHSKEALRGVEIIKNNEKVDWNDKDMHKNASIHHTKVYNWYYATQAMFHHGKSTWRGWNKMFQPQLIKNQESDGHWELPGGFKEDWTPYYATTLCTLMLEVYYRYLPTFKLPKKMAGAVAGGGAFDVDDDVGLIIE